MFEYVKTDMSNLNLYNYVKLVVYRYSVFKVFFPEYSINAACLLPCPLKLVKLETTKDQFALRTAPYVDARTWTYGDRTYTVNGL